MLRILFGYEITYCSNVSSSNISEDNLVSSEWLCEESPCIFDRKKSWISRRSRLYPSRPTRLDAAAYLIYRVVDYIHWKIWFFVYLSCNWWNARDTTFTLPLDICDRNSTDEHFCSIRLGWSRVSIRIRIAVKWHSKSFFPYLQCQIETWNDRNLSWRNTKSKSYEQYENRFTGRRMHHMKFVDVRPIKKKCISQPIHLTSITIKNWTFNIESIASSSNERKHMCIIIDFTTKMIMYVLFF